MRPAAHLSHSHPQQSGLPRTRQQQQPNGGQHQHQHQQNPQHPRQQHQPQHHHTRSDASLESLPLDDPMGLRRLQRQPQQQPRGTGQPSPQERLPHHRSTHQVPYEDKANGNRIGSARRLDGIPKAPATSNSVTAYTSLIGGIYPQYERTSSNEGASIDINTHTDTDTGVGTKLRQRQQDAHQERTQKRNNIPFVRITNPQPSSDSTTPCSNSTKVDNHIHLRQPVNPVFNEDSPSPIQPVTLSQITTQKPHISPQETVSMLSSPDYADDQEVVYSIDAHGRDRDHMRSRTFEQNGHGQNEASTLSYPAMSYRLTTDYYGPIGRQYQNHRSKPLPKLAEVHDNMTHQSSVIRPAAVDDSLRRISSSSSSGVPTHYQNKETKRVSSDGTSTVANGPRARVSMDDLVHTLELKISQSEQRVVDQDDLLMQKEVELQVLEEDKHRLELKCRSMEQNLLEQQSALQDFAKRYDEATAERTQLEGMYRELQQQMHTQHNRAHQKIQDQRNELAREREEFQLMKQKYREAHQARLNEVEERFNKVESQEALLNDRLEQLRALQDDLDARSREVIAREQKVAEWENQLTQQHSSLVAREKDIAKQETENGLKEEQLSSWEARLREESIQLEDRRKSTKAKLILEEQAYYEAFEKRAKEEELYVIASQNVEEAKVDERKLRSEINKWSAAFISKQEEDRNELKVIQNQITTCKAELDELTVQRDQIKEHIQQESARLDRLRNESKTVFREKEANEKSITRQLKDLEARKEVFETDLKKKLRAGKEDLHGLGRFMAKESDQLRVELNAREDQIKSMEQKLHSLLEKYEKDKAGLDSDIKFYSSKRKELDQLLEHVGKSEKTDKEKIRELSAQVERLTSLLALAHKEHGERVQALSSAHADSLEEIRAQHRQQLQTTATRIGSLESQLSAVQSEYEKLENEFSSFRDDAGADIEELGQAKSLLEADLTRANEKIKSCERMIEDLSGEIEKRRQLEAAERQGFDSLGKRLEIDNQALLKKQERLEQEQLTNIETKKKLDNRLNDIEALEAQIKQAKLAWEGEVTKRKLELDKEIALRRESLENEIAKRMKDSENLLAQRHRDVDEEVAAKIKALDQDLALRRQDLEQELLRLRGESETELLRRINEVEYELSDRKGVVERELSLRREEVNNELLRQKEEACVELKRLQAESDQLLSSRHSNLESESSRRLIELQLEETRRKEILEVELKQRMEEFELDLSRRQETFNKVLEQQQEETDLSIRTRLDLLDRESQRSKAELECWKTDEKTRLQEREQEMADERAQLNDDIEQIEMWYEQKVEEIENGFIRNKIARQKDALSNILSTSKRRDHQAISSAFAKWSNLTIFEQYTKQRVKIQAERSAVETSKIKLEREASHIEARSEELLVWEGKLREEKQQLEKQSEILIADRKVVEELKSNLEVQRAELDRIRVEVEAAVHDQSIKSQEFDEKTKETIANLVERSRSFEDTVKLHDRQYELQMTALEERQHKFDGDQRVFENEVNGRLEILRKQEKVFENREKELSRRESAILAAEEKLAAEIEANERERASAIAILEKSKTELKESRQKLDNDRALVDQSCEELERSQQLLDEAQRELDIRQAELNEKEEYLEQAKEEFIAKMKRDSVLDGTTSNDNGAASSQYNGKSIEEYAACLLERESVLNMKEGTIEKMRASILNRESELERTALEVEERRKKYDAFFEELKLMDEEIRQQKLDQDHEAAKLKESFDIYQAAGEDLRKKRQGLMRLEKELKEREARCDTVERNLNGYASAFNGNNSSGEED